ncbi:NlpC/P60 family protein [Kibdelosporangium philippinense]|uniref:NlpC/P60 family protein n=1 Tax=Kibdelosporangium philippinense TaxID=211113 RepID=A0ABS8ZFG8_9PSEU|nr:NlpC/P60 family protein [Kibdelosporangium philippinense]MCE7004587.1 NlpC/P60 family protein [Kibdelosporangium philippinense]
MASHRLNRTLKRSLTTAALPTAPVSAQPAESDAMKEYNDLSAQAATVDEDLLKAQADLKTKQAELAKVTADLTAAAKAEDDAKASMTQFEGQVGEFTSASYRGARLSGVSALLVSSSRDDFLERMSALGVIATDNANAMRGLRSAVDQADNARTAIAEAQRRAQEATDAAAKLTSDIKQRKTELNARIKEVKQALNRLSPSEKRALGGVKDTGSYLGPPGAANTALQAALAKRGSEYEWAAVGPREFDCSGLTMWAYNAAGTKLPHSSRMQYKLGRAVSSNELQSGDLLFFDDGTGNPDKIHHVGMYVAPGKMIDAPTEGQLVDVRSMRGDGHFIGARRYAG